MSEGIEYFEDKFAQIDINKSPIRKKKAYPLHLYPHSFRQDGEAGLRKSPSGQNPLHVTSNGPSTPIRLSSVTTKSHSTIKKPVEKRLLSYPMSEKSCLKKDYQFSFMRDTSSSLQKKHNPFNVSSAKPTLPLVSTTKKRLEYSRQLSHSIRSRRLASSTLPKSTPSDITNLPYISPEKNYSPSKSYRNKSPITHTSNKPINTTTKPINTSKYSSSNQPLGFQSAKPTLTFQSPTKYRNLSQPLPDTYPNMHTKTGNVFSRLYPNPKQSLENRMVQLKRNHQKILQQSERYEKNDKSDMNTIENEANHQRQQPVHDKISSISELYKILTKDPNLFIPPSDLISVPPLQQISTSSLNIYERGEIIRKKEIYFIPTIPTRSVNIKNYNNNFGFDDNAGNYIIVPNDHINYRYEVVDTLGNGSFGNVIRCKDHKYPNNYVAVKIIKNDLNWSLQSVNEIKMLKLLNEKEQNPAILKYHDHFNFRSHMCIVTELLSLNLYSLLELIEFKGFSLPIIQNIGSQIIEGLRYIHKLNIIHCDIKPENIMVKLNSPTSGFQIKIIDFGSSCFKNEISFTYIQSRFYRAPEVILGSSYNENIDIWSLGCVLVELFMGVPIFPGKNEIEQIGYIIQLYGTPKSSTILKMRANLLKMAQKKTLDVEESFPINEKVIKKTLLYKLFDINGKINMTLLNYYNGSKATKNSSSHIPSKKTFKINSKIPEVHLGLNRLDGVDGRLNALFLDLLRGVFAWDPQERVSVDQMAEHEFFRNV